MPQLPAYLAVSIVVVLSTGSGTIADDVEVKTADTSTVSWVRVTEAAEWQPRDSQGELVFDNKLWIFGGWFNSYEAPPTAVWNSPDGKTWSLVRNDAPWKHSDLSMSVTFRDRMWFMGGWYNGRLPGHSASNMVWSSDDGKSWKQETDAAGWPRGWSCSRTGCGCWAGLKTTISETMKV